MTVDRGTTSRNSSWLAYGSMVKQNIGTVFCIIHPAGTPLRGCVPGRRDVLTGTAVKRTRGKQQLGYGSREADSCAKGVDRHVVAPVHSDGHTPTAPHGLRPGELVGHRPADSVIAPGWYSSIKPPRLGLLLLVQKATALRGDRQRSQITAVSPNHRRMTPPQPTK